MAKRTMSKVPTGARIRVRDGVSAPEFPEVVIAGWTGTVAETSRRRSELKYMVEWDDQTIDQMPPDYLEKCEARQLYHVMACLDGDDIEPLDE